MVKSRTPKLHQHPESEVDSEAEMCLPPPSPKSQEKPGTPPPVRRHHPCFKAGIVMIYMLCGWAGVDLCLSRLQKSNHLSPSSSSADIRAESLAAAAAQRAIPTTAEGYRDRYLKCGVELGFYEGSWLPANATRLGGLYKLSESHYFSPRLLPEDEAVEGGESIEQEEGMNATAWGWQPREEDCTLRDFEGGRFCRLLRGRMNVSRILVVGDDVSFAWALSLVGMLGGPVDQDQHNWTATRVCEGSLGDGDSGALSVQYIRNDALYTSEYVLEGIAEEPGEGEAEEAEGGVKAGSADAWSGVDFVRSWPWTPYLQDAKPELLMLNLGSGVRDYDAYTRQIDRVLTWLKAELAPTTNVVFRTSSPGHQDCQNFSSPTVDLSFNRDYSGEAHDVYKWHLVGDCNAYAAAQFAGQLQSQATILHGDKLTRFRPDGHVMGDSRDCLQYVLPGVPDWWTRMLYNIMDARCPVPEEAQAALPESPAEVQVADKDPRRRLLHRNKHCDSTTTVG